MRILPITESHIEGFHAAVDVVARERKYLAFLEAPALESTRAFVLDNIRHHHPQFVVLHSNQIVGQIVGWCDIIPNHTRDVHRHCGTLGIGLLPDFRGKGIGRKLMETTLAAAFAYGLTRIELTVREDNLNAIALYKNLGFVSEGLQRHAVRIDGCYENLYAMALVRE